MSRVFVVQEPTRRVAGETVPSMDLAPAAAFGDLVFCLPNGPVMLSPAPVEDRLREVLKDFNDDDYLLPVGDPGAISVASAIASEFNRGKFKILRWDRRGSRYLKVEYDIFRHRHSNAA